MNIFEMSAKPHSTSNQDMWGLKWIQNNRFRWLSTSGFLQWDVKNRKVNQKNKDNKSG